MDPQIEKFLTDIADETLAGPGFIAYAPKEKDEFKLKLLDYYSNLIFDTLLRNLNEQQIAELNTLPDLGSEEAQNKIALMSAQIPNFIFILEERLKQESETIKSTGIIPQS